MYTVHVHCTCTLRYNSSQAIAWWQSYAIDEASVNGWEPIIAQARGVGPGREPGATGQGPAVTAGSQGPGARGQGPAITAEGQGPLDAACMKQVRAGMRAPMCMRTTLPHAYVRTYVWHAPMCMRPCAAGRIARWRNRRVGFLAPSRRHGPGLIHLRTRDGRRGGPSVLSRRPQSRAPGESVAHVHVYAVCMHM